MIIVYKIAPTSNSNFIRSLKNITVCFSFPGRYRVTDMFYKPKLRSLTQLLSYKCFIFTTLQPRNKVAALKQLFEK